MYIDRSKSIKTSEDNNITSTFCRAPADCRQYFTGVSGAVKSYNFAGGQMLASQQYTDCFRQELGNITSYFCLCFDIDGLTSSFWHYWLIKNLKKFPSLLTVSCRFSPAFLWLPWFYHRGLLYPFLNVTASRFVTFHLYSMYKTELSSNIKLNGVHCCLV